MDATLLIDSKSVVAQKYSLYYILVVASSRQSDIIELCRLWETVWRWATIDSLLLC